MSTAMKKCEAKKRDTLKLLINKKKPKSEGKEIWHRKTPCYYEYRNLYTSLHVEYP